MIFQNNRNNIQSLKKKYLLKFFSNKIRGYGLNQINELLQLKIRRNPTYFIAKIG